MSRASIAAAVANKVCAAEKLNLAALGHDYLDQVWLSYMAWTETFNRAFETERPYVWPRPRTITRDGLI